ncbi:MAG: ATP-NAD kinase [Halobacteriales archaeon]|nr:ATP-NAD kinase [Halobacteriales archaeon]
MQRPTVGILGDQTVATAVTAAGGEPLTGSPTEVAMADTDVVVGVGETAMLAAANAGIDTTILPVDAGSPFRSVARDGLARALTEVLEQRHETVNFPVATARTPFGEAYALTDFMLVTGEPARISEYTVVSQTERVATFRADGVVVATPIGSNGYTRRADGPIVAPGIDAFAVVPIAPFSTDEDMWVLPMEELDLHVERDETPVDLLADDRTIGSVVPGESVRIGVESALSVAVVSETPGRFQ